MNDITRPTVLEVDLKAFKNNIEKIKWIWNLYKYKIRNFK